MLERDEDGGQEQGGADRGGALGTQAAIRVSHGILLVYTYIESTGRLSEAIV